MPTPAEITTQITTQINVISARANALRTGTRAQYQTRALSLSGALEAGRAIIARNHGGSSQNTAPTGVSQALWDQLLATIASQDYSFRSERDRYNRGLSPSGSAAAAPGTAGGGTPAPDVRVGTGVTPRTSADLPAEQPRVSNVPAAEEGKGAPTEREDTPWGEAERGAFMRWLNPDNVEVYRKPWFIGLAGVSLTAIGWAAVSAWTSSKKSRG